MIEFLSDNFQNCVWLAVVLMAMVPTLESKVALPLGMASEIWGNGALSSIASFFFAFIGTLLPALALFFIVKFVRQKTSGFVSGGVLSRFGDKVSVKIAQINQKNNTIKKCLLLATFIAIPLPLTGAYTGAIIGGFSSLKNWQALLSLLCGHLISCVVVLLLCTIFENSAFYIFVISLILVALFVLANLVISFFRRLKERKI